MEAKLYSQHGAILPICAALCASIIMVFILLGVESLMVKWAALELRSKTESICRFVSEVAPLQKEAAYRFSDSISSLSVSRSDIVSAKLIIPSMPETFGFASSTRESSDDYSCPGCRPELSGQAISFSSLGVPGCSLHAGNDCSFLGDVNPLNTEAASIVPDSLLHDRQDAGVSATCIIGAEVRLFVSAPKPIESLATWWRPIRAGRNPSYNPAQTTSAANHPFRGLLVAVSTHLTTQAQDPRFRFTSVTPQASYELDFREHFDPLYNFATKTGFSVATLARSYPLQAQPPDIILNARTPSSQTKSSITPKAFPPGAHSYDDFSAADGLVLSDREELNVACINPAVLVRNSFVSTILELSARHAQLRNMTEFVHIGTSNRTLQNNSDITSLPKIPNSPALITPFGADLARANYQIPYVFYDSGTLNSVPTQYLPHKNGLINPFAHASNLSSAMQAHHALIANQLRYCYHLYHGAINPPGGIERYGMLNNFNFLDLALNNFGFEPDQTNQVYYRDQRLRKRVYPGADSSWDQNCPWNPSDLGTSCANPQGSSANLRAAEVASILGSTQSCPYYEAGLDNPPFTQGGICNKPDPSNLDLRADLVALLYYALRATAPTSNSGPISNFPASLSPGLFPLIGGIPQLPFNRGNFNAYSPITNTQSSIMIVLHKALSGAAEVQALRQLSTSSAFQGRPILVNYFPTQAIDSTQSAIDDLKFAFNIQEDATDASGNYLRVYSPYLAEFDGLHNYPDFQHGNDSENHRDYWHYLLTDAENNIIRQSRDYFFNVILRLELKF